MQTRKWQDKEENTRYTTEIVLQGFGGKLIMLDGKSSGSDTPSAVATPSPLDDEIPF